MDELKTHTSDTALAALAEPVLQGTGSLLEQLTRLPPLWAQVQGDGLLSQAQQLWPASPEIKRLNMVATTAAAAAPVAELEQFALAQERLRQLAERSEWAG